MADEYVYSLKLFLKTLVYGGQKLQSCNYNRDVYQNNVEDINQTVQTHIGVMILEIQKFLEANKTHREFVLEESSSDEDENMLFNLK